MESIDIRRLREGEKPPYDLLFLADPSMDMINKYIPRGYCYVACEGEEVIGVYILVENNPHTLELINIAIAESHQRKGIGKRLINHAIKASKDMGAKCLEVGTGNSSLDQLALYQKCGFRIKEIYRDFFKNNYEEKIIENGIECVDMIRLSQEL